MSDDDPVPSETEFYTSDSHLAATIQLGLVIDPRDSDVSENNIIFLDTTKYFHSLSVQYLTDRASWLGTLNLVDTTGFLDKLTRVIGSNQCIIFRYGKVDKIESMPWQRGLIYDPKYTPSPMSLAVSYSMMPKLIADESTVNRANGDFGILSAVAKSIGTTGNIPNDGGNAYNSKYTVYICNSKYPDASIFHIIAKKAGWDKWLEKDSKGVEDSDRRLPVNLIDRTRSELASGPPISLSGLGPSQFVVKNGDSFVTTLTNWCNGSYNGAVGNGFFLFNENGNKYKFYLESSGDNVKVFFHTDEWDPTKGVKVTTNKKNSSDVQSSGPVFLNYGYGVSDSSVLSLGVSDDLFSKSFTDYRNLDLFSIDHHKGEISRAYSKLVRSFENPSDPTVPTNVIDTSKAAPTLPADPNSTNTSYPAVSVGTYAPTGSGVVPVPFVPVQSLFIPGLTEQYLQDRIASEIIRFHSAPLTAKCQIVGGRFIKIWDRVYLRYIGPSGEENPIISGQYRVQQVVDTFSFNGWVTDLVLFRSGGPPTGRLEASPESPEEFNQRFERWSQNKATQKPRSISFLENFGIPE